MPVLNVVEAIPGRLFCGSAAAIEQVLHDFDVKGIVCCAAELRPSNAGNSFHVPMEDTLDFNLRECPEFVAAFDFIDGVLNSATDESPHAVYVHCHAGTSRSPTLVAAYLIARRNLTLTEIFALEGAKSIWRPNPGFISQLVQIETEVLGHESSFDTQTFHINALQSIFPAQSSEEVRKIFEACDGDVVASRNALMKFQIEQWKSQLDRSFEEKKCAVKDSLGGEEIAR